MASNIKFDRCSGCGIPLPAETHYYPCPVRDAERRLRTELWKLEVQYDARKNAS